ncbi:MAG: hypothetical protein F4003_15265 [Acidimicrobiaceae bacterium]|nr:hypothetical protein [Acidimicrobiaceae bacterium]MYC43583.1 hypothetical protein [Acidimicrobiaceae bacterium]
MIRRWLFITAVCAVLTVSCASDSSQPEGPDATTPQTSAAPDGYETVDPQPDVEPDPPTVPDEPEVVDPPTVPEKEPDSGGPEENPENPDVGDNSTKFEFDFETGLEGWTVDFADLPVNYDQSIYELDGGHRALPDDLAGAGVYVQGHNRSDDLFMYLKRRADGLQPGVLYGVEISIDFATNVPLATIGIGGSPGSSVFVKAGASTIEPSASPGTNEHLRMNIDKGNQARGGSAMAVIGDLAHPDVVDDEYRNKSLSIGPSVLTVETDDDGSVWLIVGTDSGFEGLTRLYYDRIAYTLTRVDG